jgi:hypothetical protein
MMAIKLVKNFSRKTLWSRNVYLAWEFYSLGGCGVNNDRKQKHADNYAKLACKEFVTEREKKYLRMMVNEYRRETKYIRDMY